MCHGIGVESGGQIADLRYAAPATFDIFESIVRDGAYLELGMPAFDWFSTNDIAALKAYVLSRRAQLLTQRSD